MLFNPKYRWVGGRASSIQLVGGKRRGRLDIGYESWVKCRPGSKEYFEVARGIDVIYEMTLRSWRNTRCWPRYWRMKMGKLMSILILVSPPRSHKVWWARSDLGNEAVCCYKVEYLENVMEREEVSSIFLLMFLT